MAKPTDIPALAASRVLCDLQVLDQNLSNLADASAPEGYWSWVCERPELASALRNEMDDKVKTLDLIRRQLDAALEKLGTVRAPEPRK